MASLYGSVTVANLEGKSGKDYSGLDARLTDAIIESMAISSGEVFAEAYTGAAPNSSSSNIVKYAIMTIAERILDDYLKNEGVKPESVTITPTQLGKNIYTEDVIELLKLSKDNSNQIRSVWIVE